MKTLEFEQGELKDFYHQKISELYDEIAQKDENIGVLSRKVEESNKKCFELEWKIV